MPAPSRPPRILCFGEVGWDGRPQGRSLGGAPLNVAYHLRQLGAEPILISAVGTDAAGDEACRAIEALGLSTARIARRPDWPTGTVQVRLDSPARPQFDIAQNVAWDAIPSGDDLFALAASCDALVFGTLAARTKSNRLVLDRLLDVPGPRRVLDVNLRPPFDDPERTLALCRRADWIKLNEAELARLALATSAAGQPLSAAMLPSVILALVARVGDKPICATLGAGGAVLRWGGKLYSAPAPPITVADTVGAGDAFTAALVTGLLADTSPAGLERTLARACALGALVASLPGAQPAYDAAPFTR